MARKSITPITFILRQPKSRSNTPIFGIIRFNNTHIKWPTGLSIEPEHWDFKRYRVKAKLAATDRDTINKELEILENTVKLAFQKLLKERTPLSKEVVRTQIKMLQNPVEDVQQLTLFSFVDKIIEDSPQRINLNSGKFIEHRTIQKYKTVSKVLKDFALIYKRQVDFQSIDLEFYKDFTTYLSKVHKFSTNNIGKYIQTIKMFLNEASSKGMSVNQDYKNRRFKVLQESSDNVYLNETELKALYDLDLSNEPRLERVRDLFLIGSYTGLRFSDLVNLSPNSIRNGYIKIEQLKTMEKVVIPCHHIVTSILDKYNGQLHRSISNQKMNDYIKEVCKLAGLVHVETKHITKGGNRIAMSYEKFNFISTHTARRSFATNMYKLGVPALTIMSVTGHRTEKAFSRYIKLSKEEHAGIMQKHWEEEYMN